VSGTADSGDAGVALPRLRAPIRPLSTGATVSVAQAGSPGGSAPIDSRFRITRTAPASGAVTAGMTAGSAVR